MPPGPQNGQQIIANAKKGPRTLFAVFGSAVPRCGVPGTGPWCLVPGPWSLVLGPGPWFLALVPGPGPGPCVCPFQSRPKPCAAIPIPPQGPDGACLHTNPAP